MIGINIKHNCILPYFIQFSNQMLLFITAENDIQTYMFFKIGVLKNSTVCTGKPQCFPMNIAIFLRTAFLQNSSCGCFWTFTLLSKICFLFTFSSPQIFLLIMFLNSYNHFHNILRVFDVLTNFPFTTSETMPEYFLQTWYIRAALRVAELMVN